MKRFKKNLSMVALSIILSSSIGTSVFAANFTDMANHWSNPFVNIMADHELISGYPDGSFKPDNNITRAEAASMLSKLNLPNLLADKQLKDTSVGVWSFTPIHDAYKMGVLLENSIGPDDLMTRDMCVAAASRLFGLQVGYQNVSLAQFSDASAVKSTMHWQNLVKAGIITGFPDGTLKPNNPVTRAEFARMFEFIATTPRDQLEQRLKSSLQSEGILSNGAITATDARIDFVVPNALLNGYDTTQVITLKTTNIPNGSTVNLSINADGNITIPSGVIVNNNMATFTMSASKTTPMRNYTLTATYAGKQFFTTIITNKMDNNSTDDTYLKEVTVKGTLKYGEKSTVEIVVNTNGVPNGTSLSPTINGDLSIDETKVQNGQAVYTVTSTRSTPKGNYSIEFTYNGHKRIANVQVTENGSESPYLVSYTFSDNLQVGKNSSVNMTVKTTNVANGRLVNAELGDKNTSVPASIGMSISSSAYVYDGTVSFKVNSSPYTPAGTYPVRFSYDGTEMIGYVTVGQQNGGSSTESPYITSINIDGNLRYGYSDKVTVNITTKDIPNGTVITPIVNGQLDVERVTINNNKGSFVITNTRNTPVGYYTVTVPYKNTNATLSIRVVSNDNYDNSQYITRTTVDRNLIYGRTSTATVDITTRDIPDGTRLYIDTPSGIYAPSSITIRDNRASFDVENRSSTDTGNYTLTIEYRGYTAKINVNVSSDRNYDYGTIRSLSVRNDLNYGQTSSTDVIVTTRDIPNGTILYPEVSSSLNITSGTTRVYDNEARFTVSNNSTTSVGEHRISVKYNGYTENAYVYVRDNGTNKNYISSVSVDNKLNAIQDGRATVTIRTTGIPDGTRIYPQVTAGLSVMDSCVVSNNQAIFTLTSSVVTSAGNYIVTIPYNNITPSYTFNVSVPVVPIAPQN